ncbi:MAG TPA: hypothetical protein VIU41_12180 [Geobacteraceae bacterium]
MRDNGAGFNMANAGKLFKPLQRLHGAEGYPGKVSARPSSTGSANAMAAGSAQKLRWDMAASFIRTCRTHGNPRSIAGTHVAVHVPTG